MKAQEVSNPKLSIKGIRFVTSKYRGAGSGEPICEKLVHGLIEAACPFGCEAQLKFSSLYVGFIPIVTSDGYHTTDFNHALWHNKGERPKALCQSCGLTFRLTDAMINQAIVDSGDFGTKTMEEDFRARVAQRSALK